MEISPEKSSISTEKSSSNESNRDQFEAHPSSSTIPRKARALLGLSSSENTNSDNSDEECDFGGTGVDLEEMFQKVRLQSQQMSKELQSQQMSKAKRDYFSDMNKYELLKVLDPGSQSEVFLVMDTASNTKLVLKKVSSDDGIISKNALRETSILSDLKHANVIRMYHVFVHGGSAFMVLDYMPMDMEFHMEQYMDKYPDITREFMKQILAGIAHCHKKKVVHRDIKPANLLVDPDGDTLKICDFGLARTFLDASCDTLTPQLATLRYRAPEVLLGSTEYTAAVDMWAAGCTFAEMLFLKQPFQGHSEIQLLKEIFSKLGGWPLEESWPGVTSLPGYPHPKLPFEEPVRDIGESFHGLGVNCLDLLKRLLCLDPRVRITAEEALHHKWMEGEEMER